MSLNGLLNLTDLFACVPSNPRRTCATIQQYSMYTLTLHRVELFLLFCVVLAQWKHFCVFGNNLKKPFLQLVEPACQGDRFNLVQ